MSVDSEIEKGRGRDVHEQAIKRIFKLYRPSEAATASYNSLAGSKSPSIHRLTSLASASRRLYLFRSASGQSTTSR